MRYTSFASIAIALTLAGCSDPWGGTAASGVTVAVTPKTASLQSGATQQFRAALAGDPNTAVSWSLREGASAGAGPVSHAGLYTAGATACTFPVAPTSRA